ncbi:MAG: PHP domain-containing protein, partial [Nitrospiraceae bacterium]
MRNSRGQGIEGSRGRRERAEKGAPPEPFELKSFRADLHIHTCLSPCAELEMSPSAIVARALQLGIDIIAITDHNSAENVHAAVRAARNTPLTVLGGMEITTSEEAHILALFDDMESLLKLQGIVYDNLLPGEND